VTAVSIPLGDAATLRPARTRSRIVRVVLAAALAGTGIAAFFVSRAPAPTPFPLLAPGSNGIIVLDLSASVENGTIDKIGAALSQFAASNARFGLVVFSNQAYEALPPNTPAAELATFANFFHRIRPNLGPVAAMAAGVNLRRARSDPGTPEYPTNPWANAFSFGTTISTGLDLARSVILASTVKQPTVYLISDLADGPGDLPLVALAARSYERLGIALNVIGVNPSRSDLRFFENLLSHQGGLVQAKPSPPLTLKSKRTFPTGLAVAAGLLALLLAANELWSTPLRWGSRPVSETVASA
jgi:hypothetical protein